MRLWIGFLLLTVGGALALLGYAPVDSPLATSLPLITIGGIIVACGIFVVLLASAARNDTSDIDRDHFIRA
jgi:hypothetical protein